MITLEMTEEMAVSLRNLLDLAVKAGGMRAAEFAVPLDAMIVAAATTQAQKTATPKE